MEGPAASDIVISGISGRFPRSSNVNEFYYNLLAGIDFIDDSETRWKHHAYSVPNRMGKLTSLNEFDASFFGITQDLADALDPRQRILLELVCEAILDSGENPAYLRGSNTAVFTGMTGEDCVGMAVNNEDSPGRYAGIGGSNALGANRISFYFDFRGPSVSLDTMCSSSLFCLDRAFNEIRSGKCDRAIVASAHVLLDGKISSTIAKNGILSPDGSCKVFDHSADGFARSEAAAVLILCRSSLAKRSYVTILNTGCSSDGFKDVGMSAPSTESQQRLSESTWKDLKMDPASVAYVEAHGTGTQAGDAAELKAIENFYCKNRIFNSPLPVGSVKSAVGHCEPVSGLVSVLKLILAHSNGILPGNLHFSVPNDKAFAIRNEKLRIVTGNIKWPGNLVAVNSFGFGGSNVLTVLRFSDTLKQELFEKDLPLLIPFSGRTPEMVQAVCDNVSNLPLVSALFHNIFRQGMKNYSQRGYALLTCSGEKYVATKFDVACKGAVEIAFGEIGCDHLNAFLSFMVLPVVAEAMNTAQGILLDHGVDIRDTWKSPCNQVEANVTSVCIMLAIISLFRELGIFVVPRIAQCFQECVGAYSRGCATLQQAVIAALDEAMSPDSNETGESLSRVPLSLASQCELHGHSSMAPCEASKPQNSLNVARRQTDSGRFAPCDDTAKLVTPGTILVTVGTFANHLQDDDDVYELIDVQDPVNHLFRTLGELHNRGLAINLRKLVGRKLPITLYMPISPMVKWDRSMSFKVPQYATEWDRHGGIDVNISLDDEAHSFFEHHKIHNKAVFPAAGYLKLVWDVFSQLNGVPAETLPVVLGDVAFNRATVLTKGAQTVLRIQILESDGQFCVQNARSTVCKGRIRCKEEKDTSFYKFHCSQPVSRSETLSKEELYQLTECCNVQYSGPFRSLRHLEFRNWASIEWSGNWVTFLDAFLQIEVLHSVRHKLVALMPTGIKKILLDPGILLAKIRESTSEVVRVEILPGLKTSCCPGVEIRRVKSSPSMPAATEEELCFKNYTFAPYIDLSCHQCTHAEALEFFLEVAIQNFSGDNFHIVEFVTATTLKPSDVARKSVSFNRIEFPKISTYFLPQASEGVEHKNYLRGDFAAVMEEECMLENVLEAMATSEFVCIPSSCAPARLADHTLVAQRKISCGIFSLLRKIHPPNFSFAAAVTISSNDFSWVKHLQEALYRCEDEDSVVIIHSSDDPFSGILGLFHSLQQEPRTVNRVRCFFHTSAPSKHLTWKFGDPSPDLRRQLSLNLALNAYQEVWGTFYLKDIERGAIFNPQRTQGTELVGQLGAGLSALRFEYAPPTFSSPERSCSTNACDSVRTHFVGLIYRDAMSSIIKLDEKSAETNFKVGWEFSGVTLRKGRRVFGFCLGGALTPKIPCNDDFLLEVPHDWSLLEASTVGISYATAYYALVHRATLRAQERVLIHAGAGGVGIAAIRVALSVGAKVYTTVGSLKKKQFLLELFPNLTHEQILYSRDPNAFEYAIMKETKGEGVHVVLNSLNGEGLMASLRCLKKLGRFIDIGKRDMIEDTPLGMNYLLRSVAYHSFDLVDIAVDPHEWKVVMDYLRRGMQDRTVRPIPTTLYELSETKKALMALGSGETVGKLAVRLRKSEIESREDLEETDAFAKTFFDPLKGYIIIGGLGGMSLEICKWMVDRGARKIILTTRSGFRNAYQRHVVALLSEVGCDVEIYTRAISSIEGSKALLQHVISTKGDVDGVFNLAANLQDTLFDKQSVESFNIACEPKLVTTKAMDAACRALVPNLRFFVVFSSLTASVGSPGLTNYAFANSAMARIIEQRRSCGYSGLAFQWGPVGQVGMLSRSNSDSLFGLWPRQSIVSCIQVLDAVLAQRTPFSVFTSTRLPRVEERSHFEAVEVFRKALGFSSHADDKVKLGELGLDSLTRTELEINLKKYHIDNLLDRPFAQITLSDIEAAIEGLKNPKDLKSNDGESRKIDISFGSDFRLQVTPRPKEVLVNLKSQQRGTGEKLFLVHAVDGTAKYLENFAAGLEFDVWAFQCTEEVPLSSIGDAAGFYIRKMKEVQPEGPYLLGGYSFGGVIAIEMALLLEKTELPRRACTTLLMIDAAPNLLRVFVEETLRVSRVSLNTGTILFALNAYGVQLDARISDILREKNSGNDPRALTRKVAESAVRPGSIAADNLNDVLLRFHVLLKAAMNYKPVGVLQYTRVILLKAAKRPLIQSDKLTENYNLEEIANNVRRFDVEGDHFSFHAEATELGIPAIINKNLDASVREA